MSAPDVREVIGMDVLPKHVLVKAREGQQLVYISVEYSEAGLTPNEARHLAASLYRISRRVEARNK